MFRFDADVKVYVHRDAVDFRKGIAGLSTIVEHALGLDPFARAVYVFRNRRTDRLKLLLWERNGFWLMLRRLEADRFAWPRGGETVLELNAEQLHWLLEGIDLQAMHRHPVRRYERV
ncbi:transposase [Paraburkholderia sp. Clong3]|uniref:IS66 family insertion sequence element accessory protein TnpB n=1 Tax=Paraburkholderia sp. Clong3 TaxID=2991061 RepID=UPI003D24FE0B